MGTVIFASQADPGDPLVNQARVLPCAEMSRVVDAAWKCIVGERAALAFQPGEKARAGIVHQLELNGAAGLLLNNDGAGANMTAAGQLASLNLHDVAAAQLAIDGEIEERAITQSPVLIKKEAYCPDWARL